MERNELQVDIRVPNQTRYLSLIGKIGEDIAKELNKFSGDRETLAYHINLVLTEAMSNAIKHAPVDDSDGTVHILIHISDDELLIMVRDTGQGFDINSIPQPDFNKLEDNGRGIFMIKSLMDSVCYIREAECNTLKMIKKLA